MFDFIKDKKMVVRQLELMLVDIVMIQLSAFLTLVIRYELVFENIEPTFITTVVKYAPINTLVTLGLFWFFRLYHSLWRYASITELGNIVLACLSSALVQLVALPLLGWPVPRSYYILQPIFLIILVTVERYSYRFLRRWRNQGRGGTEHRVMIVGAGEAGQMLLRELQDTPNLHYRPVCIIDDDSRRWGRYIQNVKIVGGRDRIQRTARNMGVDVIMIALPTMSKRQRKEIVDLCRSTRCEVKILPGMAQLIQGEYFVGQLRPVDLEDLLGRDTIQVDVKTIGDYVRGKRVLVTGGGGSIGSELCRQIASHNPEMLVIFDIYENNAYDIQQELIKRYPNLNLQVEIGSVRDEGRLNDIFRRFRPHLVYHAAAHKHVPLMEESPNEAVKNNVFGTLKTVVMADKYHVERFVLISTDKAVNPTSLMGATKRICEMIIQTYNAHSRIDYVAVRFGNVLGSNGSVVPLFRKQIAEGGPVTVTHPEVTRYFMTIPEAVSLVLQEGATAKGGEIFVLDMGEPVKIADMARKLIELSGLKPDEDIKIEYTGLRPGEKLYEELLLDEEGLTKTDNDLIYIGKPISFDEEVFTEQLQRLKKSAYAEDGSVWEMVEEIVPNYRKTENAKPAQQEAVGV
ncbi:MAG: polysaccharide biosynthesis protein [Clostridiales bacterium]|nr:polysaccharide biosynthesis protein [Clostridiales bacterium]